MNREQGMLLLAVIDAKIAHRDARNSSDGGLAEYLKEGGAVKEFLASLQPVEEPIGRWRLNERATERNYSSSEEIRAFGVGYLDGYYGHPMDARHSAEWPNAYGAGYWSGKGDATPDT